MLEFVNPPITLHPTAFAGSVNPWHMDDTEVLEEHKLIQGEGITIGIIGTGVDSKHVLNGDFVESFIEARDFTNSPFGHEDKNGHETHVAGLLCARVVPGRKFRGMCPQARFRMAKCLGDNGSGDGGHIADGIKWLDDTGCQVINMSCGSTEPDDRIQRALEDFTNRGGITCAAAGNDSGKLNWPARSNTVASFGAYDSQRVIAPFSCRGEGLDAAMPGVEIPSCGRYGGYAVLSGTSMACPIGCGQIVLYMAWRLKNGLPAQNLEQILNWIHRKAIDVGPVGDDEVFGCGILAGASLFELEPTPAPDAPHIPAPAPWVGETIGPLHFPAKPGDFVSVDLGSVSKQEAKNILGRIATVD